MRRFRFPDDSSGEVYGPDGPVRRTRAHTLAGYTEPVLHRHAGRNQAMFDEEGAWLNSSFFEDAPERE
jgi:hypothetical protein